MCFWVLSPGTRIDKATSAVFISVMRLYYSLKVLHVNDASYYFLFLTMWLYVPSSTNQLAASSTLTGSDADFHVRNAELMAGIVVACMPTIPKFIAEAKSVVSSTWSRLRTPGSTKREWHENSSSNQAARKSMNPSRRESWEAGSYQL